MNDQGGPDGQQRLFGGKIAYLSSANNLLSCDSGAEDTGSVSSKQHVMDLIQTQQSSVGGVGETIRILIATDQIARGIDIPSVALVINYDPPTVINTYIHRVGRTARANNSGVCCTLLKSGGQVGTFRKMRNKINRVPHESKKRKLDGTGGGLQNIIESSKYIPRVGMQDTLQPIYKKALKGLQGALSGAGLNN